MPLLPEDKSLLLGDDAKDDIAVSAQYNECMTRHRGLVKWIREKVIPALQEMNARVKELQ